MTLRRAARALLLTGLLIATAWSGGVAAMQISMSASKGPAMWRLQADGATVYFLGSFHILPPGIKWRDERVDTALAAADGVVFETNLAELDKPEVQQMIVRRATLPGRRVLKDTLSKGTYDRLMQVAEKLSLQPVTLERAQPWFAAIGVLVAYMTHEGANPEDGVDSQLMSSATAAGKTTIFLETAEQQFDALESLSKTDPDFLIMDVVRYVEDPSGLLAKLTQAWLTGDAETVNAMNREDMETYREANRRLITDRNLAWVPQIDALIRKGGTYFVVVGVGHLVGDGNVISLLEKQGYAVERY